MPIADNKENKGIHRDLYKNANKDTGSLRNKRSEEVSILRKQKREEQQSKRRPAVDPDDPTSPLKDQTQLLMLDECSRLIASTSRQDQLQGTQGARRRLSKERHPPIQEVINAGLVPKFVEFLKADDSPLLQFEAAWALTNVASGNSDETRCVADAGSLPHFVRLLRSADEQVCEQAVWAIGNIAGDGAALRDAVIAAGAAEPLIALAARPDQTNASFTRNVAWSLSNLCRHKDPHPPIDVIRKVLRCLATLIHNRDREVVVDAIWALSYCADGDNDRIQEVVNAGIISRLVTLLGYDEPKYVTPILRTLGNIVTGDDLQTQAVIDANLLPLMPGLIINSRAPTQKECAWLASNIAAGSAAQIQALIDSKVVQAVVHLFEFGDARSQREATWVLTNMTSGGTPEHIAYLVNLGGLVHLGKMLQVNDQNMALVVLDALNNICREGSRAGQMLAVRQLMEECGVVTALENIQSMSVYDNELVAAAVDKLIDEYFPDDDVPDDTGIAPAENPDSFQFNPDAAVAAGVETLGQTSAQPYNF